MAELRIGHEQVILPITKMEFTRGVLYLEAYGEVKRKIVSKLTGTQPLVIVGDDGEIVVTWHKDVTDTFAEARRFHVNYLEVYGELTLGG